MKNFFKHILTSVAVMLLLIGNCMTVYSSFQSSSIEKTDNEIIYSLSDPDIEISEIKDHTNSVLEVNFQVRTLSCPVKSTERSYSNIFGNSFNAIGNNFCIKNSIPVTFFNKFKSNSLIAESKTNDYYLHTLRRLII